MRLLFFASLRETLGVSHEDWEASTVPDTVGDLIESLKQRDDLWKRTLGENSIQCAVNQTIARNETALSYRDEVALFPPVTGG